MTQKLFWLSVFAAALCAGLSHELRDLNGQGLRWRRLFGRSFYLSMKGLVVGLIGSTLTDSQETILAAVILLVLLDFPERRLLAALHPIWGTHENTNPEDNRPDT